MANDTKYRINETLVTRFTNGDMKAFDDIYVAFNHKLQKFVFSLVKTEIDTEDLVHEVFVKVWENKEKLRNSASFDSYLFTIAYHTSLSFLRNKVKNAKYIEFVKSVRAGVDESDFAENLDREEISEKLNFLIEGMPPRQREVFKMKYFKNCSYKEIADNLKISVNTVENHMIKARRYLKGNLGKTYLSVLFFAHLFF